MTLATAALAALPLLATLGLMLLAGWSAARAAVAGLGLALLLAFAVFDDGAAGSGPALLIGVTAESLFHTASLLWILWPALALHQHQQDTGALDTLRAWLGGLSPQPGVQVLLFGWFLALFLEGAAGFGTPAAIVAPLLLALGVPAVPAVVIALLGHAAGVAFGALGTPVAALVAVTGLAVDDLVWRIATLNIGSAMALMLALCLLAARVGPAPSALGPADPAATLRIAPGMALLALLAFLLPASALALWTGPELPTLGGAALGLLAFVALLRWQQGRGSTPGHAGGGLGRALAPYAVLIALVLATRALPTLKDTLESLDWQWRIGADFGGEIAPLLHPGSLLLLALLLGCQLQDRPLAALRPALAASARRLLPVALALLAMLALSRLMLHAGMVDALQAGMVAAVGGAWPWVVPALGALGSFVTGSATASNLLFGALQVQTAESLGLPVPWLLAGQHVGAAIGNIVCPHNLVAAAAAVGLAGREAELLRRTLLPCLAVLLLTGAALAALVAVGGLRGAG